MSGSNSQYLYASYPYMHRYNEYGLTRRLIEFNKRPYVPEYGQTLRQFGYKINKAAANMETDLYLRNSRQRMRHTQTIQQRYLHDPTYRYLIDQLPN